jgi:hypothetical protein
MMSLLLRVALGVSGVQNSFFCDGPPGAATVTVHGAKEDLKNVVVRVAAPAEKLGRATDVRLEEQGNKTGLLLGQIAPARLLAPGRKEDIGTTEVSPELVFILPELKAGQTRTFSVLKTFPENGTPAQFYWKDTPGDHTELRYKQPILRYMYTPFDDSTKETRDLTYKVYHHIFAPGTDQLITKGPGGLYPHHRGLFFAFNKVSYGEDKADVWHCTGDAYQSHDGFVESTTGTLLGRHRVKVGWHGPGKKTFAEEERELSAFRFFDGHLIEFASIVRTTVGPVRLDGDPQHSGFHFRASNEVAEQSQNKEPKTYFLRPDGKGKIGEERNWDPKTKKGPVNLPWNAMSFVVGGKRYTVVYLDHPDNPKEARESERVYGRIGSYFEYDLTAKNPLRVRYRVWLQEGEMTLEQCEALSKAFTTPLQVTVK